MTESNGAIERKRRRKKKSNEADIEANDNAAIEFSTEVAATMLPTTSAKAGVKRYRGDADR